MKYTFTLIIIAISVSFYSTYAQEAADVSKGTEFETHAIGSNGMMNKSFNFGVVGGDKLQAPIGINYYLGNGVPVEELSTSVGLGWSLSAGGSITRSVRGIPDEGYKRNEEITPNGGENSGNPELTGKQFKGWIQEPFKQTAQTTPEDYFFAAKGLADSQPDIFNYSVGQYSGKFYFDHDAQGRAFVVNMDKNNVLIIPKFFYTQDDGDSCYDYITYCSCGSYDPDMMQCLCEIDGTITYTGSPPECCLENDCNCSIECCKTTCDGYELCEQQTENCLNGIGSLIQSMSFHIITPDGVTHKFSAARNFTEWSTSLGTGSDITDVPLNIGFINTWRIKESVDNANPTDKLEYSYDKVAYSYMSLGVEQSMIKDPGEFNFALGGYACGTNQEDESFYQPCDVYFNKYEAMDHNAHFHNNDEKDFQNIMYDKPQAYLINYVNALQLSEIKGKYTIASFEYGNIRLDVHSGSFLDTEDQPITIEGVYTPGTSGYSPPSVLKEIEIYNRSSSDTELRRMKRVNLNHDYYFNKTGGNEDILEVPNTVTEAYLDVGKVDCNRLILTEIQDQTVRGSTQNLTTKLYYDLEGFNFSGAPNSQVLPRRLSATRDYWGYHNGMFNNKITIPLLPFERSYYNSQFSSFDFANCEFVSERHSVWPAVKAGVLHRIETPMGSIEQFEFEAHSVNNYPADKLMPSQNNIVGGIRLANKKIINADGVDEISVDYSYETVDGQSSGVLQYIPVFISDFGPTEMGIHNADYCGSNSAICQPFRFIRTAGKISSVNIGPRVSQVTHILYERIKTTIDEGYMASNYFVESDDELNGSQTPERVPFGSKLIRTATDYNEVLMRGIILSKEIYNEQNPGTFNKIAEEKFEYNIEPQFVSFYNSNHEYGGMPFNQDMKFSDRIRVRLGSGFNNPVKISFKSGVYACSAQNIDDNNPGGKHNILTNSNNTMVSGRIEISSDSTMRDNVVTITNHEYLDFEVNYDDINKDIHTIKRIETYNELRPEEKQVQVFEYAGEDIYNDINNPFYQGDSPLIINKGTSGKNTVELFKERYIHSPIQQQNWFNFAAGVNSQLVSANLTTMDLFNSILVAECTYQYSGSSLDLSSRVSTWNTNGSPQIVHRPFINVNYTDPINSTFYNPNYNYTLVENGLNTESYVRSTDDKLNHVKYEYYENRLAKSEFIYKGPVGSETLINGSFLTYDNFNRPEITYSGISAVNADGEPQTYKSKTTLDYKIKGLGDSENSTNSTIEYLNAGSPLISISEHTLLDDLGRQNEKVQSNVVSSNSQSFLLQSNTYNERGIVETTYTIGKDTKVIHYENSPLDRQSTIESQQAINDESLVLLFGTNSANEVNGHLANTLYKSEVIDIDGRVSSKFLDYLERPIIERRFNESGLASDTRRTYDSKGRLSQIIPPSGPVYSYAYNDRGLIATKTVPHGGTRLYFYDKLLRPVLEIDANGNKMLTVYDNFDRVIRTGLIKRSDFVTPSSVDTYYNVGELDLTIDDVTLTQTNYQAFTGFIEEQISAVLDPTEALPTQNLYTTFGNYDEVFGSPGFMISENITGGQDVLFYKYNDAGQVYYSLHKHAKPDGNEIVFQQTSLFDEMNRPWKTYLAFEEDETVLGQLLSELEYDEFARVKIKKLHEVNPNEFLQEIDYVYDEFGRISKINDSSTMFDNCDVDIYCNYTSTINSDNDVFQLGELFYNSTSFLDLSSFSISSQDDPDIVIANILTEIENQILAGDGDGPLSTIIIDDINYEINEKPDGTYELVLIFWQTNYEFSCLIVNENNEHLERKDCCGDVGPIAQNDLYWQELSYLNYIDDGSGTGQTIAKNSTNIHRKDYGYVCGPQKIYQYDYDALNRLHVAHYAEGFMPSFVDLPEIETNNTGLSGLYSTQINYENDLGDIAQIFRFSPGYEGTFDAGTVKWDLYDAIDYNYNNSGILLTTTEYGDKEKGHKSTNQNGVNLYGYDLNGNVTGDSGKDIDLIEYTHFNLPSKITNNSTNEELQFIYSGEGLQLQKRHIKNGNPVSKKSYMSGIEYSGNSISNSQIDAYLHSDGLIKINADGEYKFQYYIKDHLGNNVVVFGDKNKNDYIEEYEVIQQNDYYPFGAKMEKTGTQASELDNQYKYNGKEIHNEMDLKMYAYGARFYDPNIARFTGVDPIADQFAFVSVFNYAENNPIKYIDLHGLQKADLPAASHVTAFTGDDKLTYITQIDNFEPEIKNKYDIDGNFLGRYEINRFRTTTNIVDLYGAVIERGDVIETTSELFMPAIDVSTREMSWETGDFESKTTTTSQELTNVNIERLVAVTEQLSQFGKDHNRHYVEEYFNSGRNALLVSGFGAIGPFSLAYGMPLTMPVKGSSGLVTGWGIINFLNKHGLNPENGLIMSKQNYSNNRLIYDSYQRKLNRVGHTESAIQSAPTGTQWIFKSLNYILDLPTQHFKN